MKNNPIKLFLLAWIFFLGHIPYAYAATATYCSLPLGAPLLDTDIFAVSKNCAGTKQISGADLKAYFATVATTGSYLDLINQPTFNTFSPLTTLGDTLYENSTPAGARLAGNITTTKKYLSQTGTGAGSAAPAWNQPACGDLSNAAASCSTDTTNASNISSGTIGAGRLPNPSATTLGGVESISAVANNFLTSISTSGVPAQARPTCANLSDSVASCSTDATNASNISTGTLPAGRLPNPSATTLGGVESLAAVSNNFLTSISTAGVPIQARPTCANLSDSSASCATDATNASNIGSGTLPAGRLPNPSATTLGGVESITSTAHNFLTTISTAGVPSKAQPACADISDAAASCNTDATNASNIGSGTLPAGRLPNPSATTLGGVESLASTAHNFLTSISTSGVPAKAQPACADLSDAVASCSTDATNATNIGSGTLAAGRMPALTGDVTTSSGTVATTVGKVNGITYSATAAAHSVEVVTTANTTATAKVIPDCVDTGGNHLNYTQSTDAFSCGTTGAGGGSGTVTSVTFTGDGTVLSSTPSTAVTTTGTLTAALLTQTANKIFAGPASGSAANPTFRSLVKADLPTANQYAASAIINTIGGI